MTVVDTGCCIEHDPHGSLNPLLAARRNAAAITALSQGDVVVSVGRADPLGLSRLANAYPQLLESAADADRLIAMINPLRGVVGRLVRKGAHARLVLSVDLIGQAVAVEVDASDVKPY